MNKWLLIFLLFLTGCKMGPNYCRPGTEVPHTWRTSYEANDVNLVWWQQFNDPVLNDLIQIALQENYDLREATYRIDEFFGLYRSTRSELFPQISAETLKGRERISEKLTPTGPGIKNPDNVYQLLLTGSWEIDLWGRIRRATEAAYADLMASKEARQTVIQNLVAAVATAYVDLLRLDQQFKISIETTRTRKQTLELFQKRHRAGVISKIELVQIESEYLDSLSTIAVFEKLIEQQENAICLLLGRNPGPIPRGKTINDLNFPKIPSGTPSELLYRRPDIREAEELLIASNSRIGVARAAYFPSISLTGLYGGGSRELADLFSGDARTWNYFVPTLTPLFTGGRLSGNLQAATAVRNQAVQNYKQTILTAFGEVEDALVNRDRTHLQLEVQGEQVKALLEYARLARLRFDEGYASYLEVLDAERSLFNAELDYSETQGDLFLAYVNIYKSMGGGWICEADKLTN